MNQKAGTAPWDFSPMDASKSLVTTFNSFREQKNSLVYVSARTRKERSMANAVSKQVSLFRKMST